MKVNKFYGLQDQDSGEDVNSEINKAYFAAPIVLGMHHADTSTERVFLAFFEEFNENIFLYSDFPEEEVGKGGGDDWSKIIFDNYQQIVLGLSVSLMYDILKISGKKIFAHLKKFLVNSHKHKPQGTAIKIKVDGGADVTYRLPKHLTSGQIETAVDRIEKDCGDEKTIHTKLWTSLVFDTKNEKFEEE